LKLTTDRQEASRCLSATAELLVHDGCTQPHRYRQKCDCHRRRLGGALSPCDAQASSYLGSGRMTEVIRVALYTDVLGPWDGDCAGGRLLSTDN